jgi:hypothetical protein
MGIAYLLMGIGSFPWGCREQVADVDEVKNAALNR